LDDYCTNKKGEGGVFTTYKLLTGNKIKDAHLLEKKKVRKKKSACWMPRRKQSWEKTSKTLFLAAAPGSGGGPNEKKKKRRGKLGGKHKKLQEGKSSRSTPASRGRCLDERERVNQKKIMYTREL